MFCKKTDLTWEYAFHNEQNIWLLRLEEVPDENLEAKFIECMQGNLGKEVKPDEIKIIQSWC